MLFWQITNKFKDEVVTSKTIYWRENSHRESNCARVNWKAWQNSEDTVLRNASRHYSALVLTVWPAHDPCECSPWWSTANALTWAGSRSTHTGKAGSVCYIIVGDGNDCEINKWTPMTVPGGDGNDYEIDRWTEEWCMQCDRLVIALDAARIDPRQMLVIWPET